MINIEDWCLASQAIQTNCFSNFKLVSELIDLGHKPNYLHIKPNSARHQVFIGKNPSPHRKETRHEKEFINGDTLVACQGWCFLCALEWLVKLLKRIYIMKLVCIDCVEVVGF